MARRKRSQSRHGAVQYGAQALESRVFLSSTIFIADSSAIEPAPDGSVNMDFTVTRTGDLTSQVTVGYTTLPGTAQANTDFTPATGTATFASGSSTTTIAVPIFNDGTYNNPGLTFSVELTGITNVVGPPVTLAAQTTFATGSTPYSVATADLNGDGEPDLIVANTASSTVSLLLNTTAPGASTPSFAAQQTFPTGSRPTSVTVADLTGDGKLDLIVANNSSNTVSVLLNTTPPGASTLSFAAQQTFATGSAPFSVTTADMNGDGKPDIIVANDVSNTVSVLLNTTSPGATAATFAAQQTFATGSAPYSVTTADLNGDGEPDIITANTGSNSVSVLLNTTPAGATTLSFTPGQSFATGSNPFSVTAADLNGDGRPDLIVANPGSSTVSVLLNTTSPGATTASFAAQQTFATGEEPNSVTTADLNEDGKLDIIVANYGDNSTSVLVNTTAPGATTASFAPQQSFATGRSAYAVTAADLNGDGEPDIIVANEASATVSVLLNTTPSGATTPSFGAQQTFGAGSGPFTVSTADLNGDGEPDLIVANKNSNSVSVLLNTTPPGAATPSFADQQTFATGSKPDSVTTADVNGDGKPDIIVANSGSNSVSVLLNLTPPGATTPFFAAQQTFSTGTNPFSVTTADVNGDGKPDLIVANSASNTVSVLLDTTAPGTTTLSFAAQQTFATGINPSGITTADVNGDGKPDIIVANTGSDTVSVLLNTTPPGSATPTFAAQLPFSTGDGAYSVTTADVNGDGKPDIIVANSGPGTVSVLLNATPPGSAIPQFYAQQTFATGEHPFSVTTADLNGDGTPVIVVANYLSGSVSELINTTPPGTTALAFATQQTSFAGANPFSVTTADLNGDGRPDLITTQLGSSTVSVLLNSPTTIAAGTATGTINDQYVLVIDGTSGDDVITVQSDGTNLTYTTNGATSSPVPLTAMAGIVVNGLAGNDLITIEPSMPASLGVSVLGGPGDDTIMGGPGNDTLAGGQGNDSISGGPGDDSIKGGQGDDTLAGGKGNDTIFGSLGNDLLRGGLGDDSLNGGAGTNQMYGGQGNNTFYAVNGAADQIFAGAATNDSLFYSSSDNPIIESGVIPAGNKMLVP